VFAYLYVNMDPTEFLFITGVTFIGYGIITGIAELFGAVLVGFLFAVLPQITATPINGVNQTIFILQGVLLVLTIYSYPSGLAGFMKRVFRPDDETAQILTAREFSPAPTAADPPLAGNGGDHAGRVSAPTAAGARATSPSPSAAAATATLEPRTVTRAAPDQQNPREEALWSRAVSPSDQKTPARPTRPDLGSAPAAEPAPAPRPGAPPTARNRPLRARPPREAGEPGSRPLRPPGRPRPSLPPEEDESP
jgi:hypothetical protein